MATHPWRAKQTTTTTGTGTLTLSAATSNNRSFQNALGAVSIVTPYVLSGANFYERGIGTFDGGNPGSLTRTTIIASSNANAAVSLPAGTTDVFVPHTPGLYGLRTGAGSDAPGVALIGERYQWTGTVAGTLSLPAAAVCPPGIPIVVENSGVGAAAILTIDGNGGETIGGRLTIALYPGQSATLIRRGANWDAPGYTGVPPLYKTGLATMTAGIVAISFPAAFPNAILDASAEQSGASAVGTFNGVALSTLAITGFTAYSAIGYGGAVRWRAWGY